MTGTLCLVKAINWDFENQCNVVEVYYQVTLQEIDAITHISTRAIPCDPAGRPNVPQDQWGVVEVEEFHRMGGFFKRSPDGNLAILMPLGSSLIYTKLGDRLFFSKGRSSAG